MVECLLSFNKSTRGTAHFLKLLQEGTVKKDIDTQFMGFTEAVKQFERHVLSLEYHILLSWIHMLK